jgi:hypothetical protein
MNHNPASLIQEASPIAEAAPDDLIPQCRFCHFEPCLLDTGLYQVIVDYEQDLRKNNRGITNKSLRFNLERHVSNWIEGFLGKDTHFLIPVCVHGEILDLAPDPSHPLVCFQECFKDNLEK